MDIETANAIISIATSLTTNAVLMLWLYREMKRSDNYQHRLELKADRDAEDARSKEAKSIVTGGK